MSENNNILGRTSLIVGALALCGIVVYFCLQYGISNYLLQPEENMSSFQSRYSSALFLESTVNPETITELQVLLDDAPNKEYEGKVKILLASNLYLQAGTANETRAVQLYKEVWNDLQIPPYLRAMVPIGFANMVRDKDEFFYKTHFTENPFKDLLPLSGGASTKISTVYLKMLELSDQTHPNSYAKYLIAGNYYAPLLVNNKLPSELSTKEAARVMREYVEEADELSLKDESVYKPEIILKRYFYRALAIGAIARVESQTSPSTREDAYKLVLQKGSAYEGKDYGATAVLMKTRFYYASLLNELYGTERRAEILDLLRPFAKAASADPVYQQTRNEYAQISGASQDNFTRTRFMALGKISPEFKSFAISLGLVF